MFFKEGDLVTVLMAHNDCLGLGLSLRFKATILSRPCATGDMWRIGVCLEDKDVVIALNPQASDFIGFVKYLEEKINVHTKSNR